MHISKSVCHILVAIAVVATFAAPVLSAPNDQQVRKEFNTLTGQLNHRQLTPSEKARYKELRKLVIPPQRQENPLDNQGGPDQFGYFFMDNVAPDTATYAWIELCGDPGATDGPGNADDDCSITANIGFSFPFYGTTYTTCYPSTNGLIGFVACNSDYWASDPASEVPIDPYIAPYWQDQDPESGTAGSGCNADGNAPWIRWETFGTAPNRYFVTEWRRSPQWGFTTALFSYEAILYESGRIKVQFHTDQMEPAGYNWPFAIGLDAPGAGNGLRYYFNDQVNPQGYAPEPERAIWIFQAEGIPNPVTDLVGSAAGPNVVLSWVDPTSDTNGNPIAIDNVQVWLGPVGSGELLATVNPGVQTYTHVGAGDGFHTYNVRAFNDPYYGNPASVTVLVGDFPWHPTDYDWVDISGIGTLLPLSLDDYSDAIDIGFEFTFFDQIFTQLWVGSHGFVTLNDVGGNFPPYDNTAIPDPMDPNNSIYCFWDDNSSSTTGAIYYYQDTVEGRFIVSWDGVGHFGSGEQYWFQVILNDDGSIVMNYQTIPINTSCTIGVEDGTGSNGLQACFDGQGDFLPTNNSAIIFYEQSGITAPVSGHVTLDGGSGNITQVLVQASGPGHPTTNPDALGNYTLDSVATGNRRILASHTGYITDTLLITLDSTGYTGADLTIRRVNPPQPTGLTGSVNNGTGVVTLNWDDSTDPLVDFYRVYRKLSSDPDWTLDETRLTSDDTDTLTIAGIYMYAVSAVDDDVLPPPVESDRSTPVTLLYGNLAPTNLSANGNFDDRIRLSWLSPGVHPSYQLMYDDSSYEAFGVVQFPNGAHDYFAVRFTPPSADTTAYPLAIQTANLYLQTTDLLPNVLVCPDIGGIPNLASPLASWQDVGADAGPGWLTVATDGTVMLDSDADFWVVMQFPPGINGPGIGLDTNSPDLRSYWSYDTNPGVWQQWTPYDMMMRVWVGGEPGWGFVMSVGAPSGYSVERIPMGQTSPTREAYAAMNQKRASAKSRSAGPLRERAVTNTSVSVVHAPHFPIALEDRFGQPYSLAPALVYQERTRDHGHGNSLDDIVYYRIFRDNVFLANDTTPPYDDVVGSAGENIPHTYFVRAHYDNNQDSDSTNHATAMANMAPAAPTDLVANPQGSQMQLLWADPTVNSDGTPCVDLANIRVYRNGTQITTVPAGVMQYLDTPPQNRYAYWTLVGADEVPNLGPVSVGACAVVGDPWEGVWDSTDYEWVDISGNGTDLGLSDDSYSTPVNIGFNFPFLCGSYTQLRVASNGFIEFDPADPYPYYTETAIPNTATPNNAIYVFWDDMNPSMGGSIMYLADTQNNRFIVSYLDVPHFSSGETYTYQVILGDDGSITLNYQTIPINTSCTVGVENQDGTEGSQVCFDGAGWLPTNGSAIAFWGGPSGRIEGTVRAFLDNQPIEGILVETMQLPTFTYTDVNGFYSLRLDPGTYSVRFSGAGYCDTTYTDILVEDNQTTIRNATLRSPFAQFSVTSISMATWPGHNVSYGFDITNPGGQCALDFSISDTSNWLSANPVSGSVAPNGTVTVNAVANVQGLNPGGDYQSALVITHDALGSPTTIPVSLSISLTADQDPASLPTVYALHPNYPNPFNATTSLRFDLPQASRVKLVVFNVMGQAVVTVADGMYPAGRHSLSFDATDLPSGMYLLKLEAGSYRALQKMLLLK